MGTTIISIPVWTHHNQYPSADTAVGKSQGGHCHNYNMITIIIAISSVLARQPSRVADPLLRSSRGDPPLCIGKQEVGTYIYSLLYTHTGHLG